MFPNTRALVVDHRLANRQQLRQRLEAFEVQVEEEFNGSRGVDRALNERFDIIFMAPSLPILDAVAVQDILRRSGVRAVITYLHRFGSQALADSGQFMLVEPVEQGSLESLLSRVLPDQRVDSLAPVVDESLRAMWKAVDSLDIEQVASLVQRLREISMSIESAELLTSIDRLELCLVEDDQEELQLRQLRSTLRELSTIVRNSDVQESSKARAGNSRGI